MISIWRENSAGNFERHNTEKLDANGYPELHAFVWEVRGSWTWAVWDTNGKGKRRRPSDPRFNASQEARDAADLVLAGMMAEVEGVETLTAAFTADDLGKTVIPARYAGRDGVETIDRIRAKLRDLFGISAGDQAFAGHCIACAMKYDDRAPTKTPAQAEKDRAKAVWYQEMASHVLGFGPDPRAERPGFVALEWQKEEPSLCADPTDPGQYPWNGPLVTRQGTRPERQAKK